MVMTEIVLRVRLIGGEHLDVTYEEDGGKPDEIVDRVVSALAAATRLGSVVPSSWMSRNRESRILPSLPTMTTNGTNWKT